MSESKDEPIDLLVREARRKMLDWAKNNIPENDSIKYEVEVDEFNELTVRRGDIKNIIKHVHENAADVYLLCDKLDKVMEGSEYLGWSYDETFINSEGKEIQRHPNVGYWLYYKYEFQNKATYVNILYDKQRNEYRVYCIRDSYFNINIIQFQGMKK